VRNELRRLGSRKTKNTSGIARPRDALAVAPPDNREPRHTACMCDSLYVCAQRGPNNSGLTARVAQPNARRTTNKHPSAQWQCTARSAAQPSRLRPTIVTGRDTFATPGCAVRTVYESGRLPRGCALLACYLLVARLAGSAQRNCPTNQRPVPHRRNNMTCRRAGEK
jgi:hypothetical protein